MRLNAKKLGGWFIIFVMVFSIFGIVASYQATGGIAGSVPYNDFAFVQTQNGWRTTIDGTSLSLYNFPAHIEYLVISPETTAMLNAAQSIVITYDPVDEQRETLSQVQYYMGLQLENNVFVQRAVMSEAGTVPIITCDTATIEQPVIVLASDNTSSIVESDSCIILKGPTVYDLLRNADRTIYAMLGVMNG